METGHAVDAGRVAVLGAGAWGTALAALLAGKGLDARLWTRRGELARSLRDARENKDYLPGVALPPNLLVSSDPSEALRDAPVLVWAVPTQHTRETLKLLIDSFSERPVLVCASKGIEIKGSCLLSKVVEEALAELRPSYFMLSGPSFAKEVGQGLPAAVSLGCSDIELGRKLIRLLSTDRFRVYANADLTGVELGGAVKNVIAIASGIADGLGFGDNARAALITRGLAEMSRLGEALGADPRTFMGLSGLGDLVLTATGDLSRNRQVGLRLGRGETLEQIMAGRRSVAEGVLTAKALRGLARERGLELPITEQVNAVLHEGKDPRQGVSELMSRTLKDE